MKNYRNFFKVLYISNYIWYAQLLYITLPNFLSFKHLFPNFSLQIQQVFAFLYDYCCLFVNNFISCLFRINYLHCVFS